jgi:DNA-binding NarL/FixJ family response regulator
MSQPLLYDIIESPSHPDLAKVVAGLGLERLVFSSQRKAMSELKRRPPDLVVADFFYGYGNNYAGANVSNLDVLLRSLQRFAPQARIIVLADRSEAAHVDRLAELFTLHAVIVLPSTPADLEQAIRPLIA